VLASEFSYIVSLVPLSIFESVLRRWYILKTSDRLKTILVVNIIQYFVRKQSTSFNILCKETIAFNLLKPTGYVMHQQFNIQQLYALPTQYLSVLFLSEKKQRLVPLTA
jgi:hypothetical protein